MKLIGNNITKKFGELEVLKGIDLTINSNEIVAIVGDSGAGKTTLLQILGTLDTPTSGTVFYDDKNINLLKSNQLAKFRNIELGFVFQFHHLLPEFTCFENICIPAMIALKNKNEMESRANELMSYLKIDHRKNHKPSEMSGGEQQRCAVARALMNQPKFIFADEPSGNLDSKNAKDLHQLFLDLRKDFGYTFVIVTHNEELSEMADRKLVMKDGYLAT